MEDTSNLDYEAGQEEGEKDAQDPKEQKPPEQGKQKGDAAPEDEQDLGEEGEEINEDNAGKYEDRQFANPQVQKFWLQAACSMLTIDAVSTISLIVKRAKRDIDYFNGQTKQLQ